MISRLAYVSEKAKIGANVTIHPFAYIDDNVEIGDNCEIMPYASIMHGTRMGRNNKVYQSAIIGADPQDFRWGGDETYCYIGDDNVIREQVIINRGIKYDGGTRIGDGVVIMAQSHIGHDSHIQGRCVLGNGVSVAGNVVIEPCTILSSHAVVHEKSHIGQWVLIKGGTRIGSNVPPYLIMAHNPATYYGVNSTIMRKKGFTDEDIENVAKAYRHLYQTQTSVYNALKSIEADIDDCEILNNILNFVRNNNLKLAGVESVDML